MEKQISEGSSRKISWLMFLCSCLIVLRHSSGYDNYAMGSSFWDQASVYIINMFRYNGIYNFVLPSFFLCSGFLFYRSFSLEQYGNKMKKRMKSLVIPYLAWNTFWMLVMALMETIPAITAHINSMQRFTLSFESIVKGIFLHLYNPSFWFVFQIILYTVMSPILYTILKKKSFGGGLILLLFLAYSFDLSIPVIRIRGIVWYVVGAFLAMHFFELVNVQINSKLRMVSSMLLFASFVVYDFLPNVQAIKFLYTLLQMTLLWCAIDWLKNVKVQWWVKIHFYIFGLHQVTQLCVNQVICMLVKDSRMALVNFFGGAIITIMICIASAYVLKKWMKPIWTIANGGR